MDRPAARAVDADPRPPRAGRRPATALAVDVRGSLLTGEHRYLINGAVVAATATVEKRLQFHGGAGLTWPQLIFLFWLELSIRRGNANLPVTF